MCCHTHSDVSSGAEVADGVPSVRNLLSSDANIASHLAALCRETHVTTETGTLCLPEINPPGGNRNPAGILFNIHLLLLMHNIK